MEYILKGISRGFHIGHDLVSPLEPARRNIPSAGEHPEVITKYIEKECAEGRVLGPFQVDDIEPRVQISRFGVIPKGHTPGKWRLILDLSFPEGSSVNDGIPSDLCSIQYLKIEEVAQALVQSGLGTPMAKIDVESAYRIIPVAPADRHLLGMCWQNQLFIDAALPFGLRSAPIIFNSVADALLWILREQSIRPIFHYLDDFITMGEPGTNECERNMRMMRTICELLGVPLSREKCIGPTLTLTYLGFEFSTVTMEIRLPREKLERIKQLVGSWSSRKMCTIKQLESLIGELQHVSAVVRPGRSFLHRMIALLAAARKRSRYCPVRLNKQFQSDLAWWRLFVSGWSGIALMRFLAKESTQITLTTDASGQWGCGGFIEPTMAWFQWQWDMCTINDSIAVKELFPILLATALYGKHWKGYSILCRCDNQAVVAVVRSRYAANDRLMHLLRVLFFLEAHYNFHLVAEHIAGNHNTLADHISRNRHSSFLQHVPGMPSDPTPIPSQLSELLLLQEDWTSSAWQQTFSNFISLA